MSIHLWVPLTAPLGDNFQQLELAIGKLNAIVGSFIP
jgi:hypothetical protein